jgi:hypothetical protein
MRTDATIDRKQVICRNSSHLGYSKVTARTGDIVIYSEGKEWGTHVGRVIGRIAYAPSLANEAPIRKWLLLACLSNDLTCVGERWVNPEDVSQVFAVREETRKLLAFFLSDGFGHESVDTLRRWTASGFATANDWLEYELTHEPVRADSDGDR